MRKMRGMAEAGFSPAPPDETGRASRAFRPLLTSATRHQVKFFSPRAAEYPAPPRAMLPCFGGAISVTVRNPGWFGGWRPPAAPR